MPGAQPGNPPGPQPVSTEPPAPQHQAQPVTPPAPAQQQQPNPPAPQANPQQQTPPATGEKPPEGESWKEYARLWEQRAKGKGWDDLEEKARKWEEAEAAKRTQAENDRIAIETERNARVKAETELARERVSRETGVIPELLSGTTEDEMRAAAAKALEWRGPGAQTPPPPATAAVPASEVTSGDKLGHAPNQVQQLTREQFAALSPAERMAAVRAGQCTNIGIGQPRPGRRMGNQLELSAVGTNTPASPGAAPAAT
jgi:hypothetical protein